MPTTPKVKVKDAVDTAKPVVERLARDDEFRKHLKSAFESARHIYDDVLVDETRSPRAVAQKLALDRDVQDELRSAIEELREAGRRVRKARKPSPSHKSRNAVLLAGILLGVLYNPATGAETRRWLKERIFGPEETFTYEP
jgi:hypothetical protein